MDVIGIIAEYNPFHNGHIYQIQKIKEMYPSSLIIVILDNYFTQRGDISILTKKDKVKLSLDYVDIVVELPTLYSTQSSDIFAYNAISILNNFHITKLCFGSESNNIDLLKKIASVQEDKEFSSKLKLELDKGLSYPNALKYLINIDFNYTSNDLLAISYIKAINKINKNIEPITIQRTNDYNDTLSNETIISATNIRNKFIKDEDVSKYTPSSNRLIKINYDLYFNILKHKILTDHHLDEYIDVNEGIENRLIKYVKESNTLEEFIEKVKTKRYSYNKIRRMLLHIVLGLRKEDNKIYNHLKVLGFTKKGQSYLKENNIIIHEDTTIKNIELNISKIYDLLTNLNTYDYELKNIPIKKE